ncbi:MAG: hypothetical protein ACXAEU_23440 [Candidatus Hodarchaeales archaeon]
MAHMNTYLNSRFGKSVSDDYFRYYVKQFIKRYGQKYGAMNFVEFIDYLSYIGEFMGQAHVIADMDETKQIANILIVDCLPVDIMEDDRNFFLYGDFPCSIWCQNFIVKFCKYAGYNCIIKDHEEGCLFELSKPSIEEQQIEGK